jgi:transglutaminase-like putative cysteine protease
VLLAASATNSRPEGFYWILALLLVWALWIQRVRRFAPAIVAVLIVVVAAGGYAGNFGLRGLQRLALSLDTSLMSRFSRGKDFSPRQHRSLLGSVGRIKTSGKIVLWVNSKEKSPPPLLREASYDQFTSPVWHVSNREYKYAVSENDQTTWKLLENRTAEQVVTISRHLTGGRGLLAVPNGTFQIERLPAFLLQTNTFGVMQVTGPGAISYDALFGRQAALDAPYTAEDTRVSARELSTIARVAEELNLSAIAARDPREALTTVANYFAQNFTYSTWLEPAAERPPKRLRATNRTDITRFLLDTRKGHCEYFAAATVLLLRQAKIPARYAVGYSVQEGSGGKYVVRDRHAHAWCLAYIDNTWVDFDTTPSSWNSIESQRAPWWEPLSDAWSRVWFQISKLRWSGVNFRKYLLGLLVPTGIILGIIVYRRRQWVRAGRKSAAESPLLPGADSEFYLVETRLGELGFGRNTGEPMGAWLGRVNGAAPRNGVPLENLLDLHYRYRFDPAGLTREERQILRQQARSWLENATRNGSERG